MNAHMRPEITASVWTAILREKRYNYIKKKWKKVLFGKDYSCIKKKKNEKSIYSVSKSNVFTWI